MTPRNMARPSSLTIKDLQQFKRAVHRAPPPKAPLGTSSAQYAPTGSWPGQDGGQLSEEGVISIAKFRFRKTGSRCVDKNSNAYYLKGEPPRKKLPPFFRMGAAPPKPAKPDHLKLTLRRFQERIEVPVQGKKSYRSLSNFHSPREENHSPFRKELERESRPKMLPSLLRIGAAPPKPVKPEHLKFRLRRFQDKIVLSAGVDFAVRTSKQGRLKPNLLILRWRLALSRLFSTFLDAIAKKCTIRRVR